MDKLKIIESFGKWLLFNKIFDKCLEEIKILNFHQKNKHGDCFMSLKAFTTCE